MTCRRFAVTCLMTLPFVAAATFAVRPLAAQERQPPRLSTEVARNATERLLFRLEDQWAAAVLQRNGAAMRRLVDRRWIYSDEGGWMNREQGIAAFTGGTDSVTAAANDFMRATVYGNTAVVTGILWVRGYASSVVYNHRFRFTDTWMKIGGRWQCIASQDYLLPVGTTQ